MIKYKINTLFILIMVICATTLAKADDYKPLLLGKIIYIDPGHGGYLFPNNEE